MGQGDEDFGMMFHEGLALRIMQNLRFNFPLCQQQIQEHTPAQREPPVLRKPLLLDITLPFRVYAGQILGKEGCILQRSDIGQENGGLVAVFPVVHGIQYTTETVSFPGGISTAEAERQNPRLCGGG